MSFAFDKELRLDKHMHKIRALGSSLKLSATERLKKEQEAAFRVALAGFLLLVFDVLGDGNCLFRAISHQLYGTTARHEDLRRKCCAYIKEHRDYFARWLAEDVDAYLGRMRKPGQWGDHIELVALREIFNVNIVVYAQGSVEKPNTLGFPLYEGLQTLMVSYHGGNHYNSITRQHTEETDAVLVDAHPTFKWEEGKSKPPRARVSLLEIRIKQQVCMCVCVCVCAR
jgi:hypothetical protein